MTLAPKTNEEIAAMTPLEYCTWIKEGSPDDFTQFTAEEMAEWLKPKPKPHTD